jgi:hypothetical protein
MIDWPAGTRAMTTLRKLPTIAPSRKHVAAQNKVTYNSITDGPLLHRGDSFQSTLHQEPRSTSLQSGKRHFAAKFMRHGLSLTSGRHDDHHFPENDVR